MIFREKIFQVLQGPERLKCRTFGLVHICIIWALCLKQEPIKKPKGDRSYGVHKVGTVDDISQKSTEKVEKCKTFGSVQKVGTI